MVDWSQLPRGAVDLIADHLCNCFDHLHFRSVCSSWRHSVSPKPPFLPPLLPSIDCDTFPPTSSVRFTPGGFHLRKRTVIALRPLDSERKGVCRDWLVKVEETSVPQTVQVMDPLSGRTLKPRSSFLPKTLDMRHIRVLELGHEYVLQFVNSPLERIYERKVAINWNPDGSFVALTIDPELGTLMLIRSGDRFFSRVSGSSENHTDVILFQGCFFAVDCNGGTVMVETEPSPRVIHVACGKQTFFTNKMCLVESEGNLLLVFTHISFDSMGDDEHGGPRGQFNHVVREDLVTLDVYRLEFSRRKWKSENLRDRILFLGEKSSFCVSSSQFSLGKGNVIYFSGNVFTDWEPGSFFVGTGVSKYRLDDDLGGVSKCPTRCLSAFWPAPPWVMRTPSLDHGSPLSTKRGRCEGNEDDV